MKRVVYLVTVIALLLGCSGRREQMSALLDRADSLNRAYVPMTGGLDSLLLEAADYYDHHGTPNEQMRAHYLLGCAYRDMGEAPQALQCYQDAVDCADTLASDCDYRRLMSVYGQMASLFHQQNLPHDELMANQIYGKYALLIGDTLLYIRNLELYVRPYYLMGDTLEMLKVLQQAHDLYLSHGFSHDASGVYGPVIDYYISKGQLDEASRLMKEYEEMSGLFDIDGNIVPSREIYYYIQGSYYLKRNELSYAERCFRKLPVNYKKDAYKGLLSVFRLKGDLDSVAKYAYLYEIALDTLHDQMRTEVVHQMSAMYNYQRFQREAVQSEKAKENSQRKLRNFMIAASFLIGILIYTYYSYRRKKQRETAELYFEYRDVLSKYYKNVADVATLTDEKNRLEIVRCEKLREIETLKEEKDAQIEAKVQEISSLKEQMLEYQNKVQEVKLSKKLLDVLNNDIVKSLHNRARRRKNSIKLSDTEWKEVNDILMKDIPFFYSIIRGDKLSVKEYRVCSLLLLNFASDEICVLLDISPQRLTNIRRIINQKLFNEKNARSLEENFYSRIGKV